MPKKEASEIVVLSWADISGSNAEDKEINLSFTPDEAIIKCLSYSHSAVVNGVHKISSNLFNKSQSFIAFSSQGTSFNQSYDIPIQMYGNTIQGQYSFSFSSSGTAVAGRLSLVIEFVKYKKYKK